MNSHNQTDIGSLLAHVKKPSRYLGNEFNVFKKDWEAAALRIALVFPDLYEIGMSHHGLQILYSVLNSEEDVLADRVYAPDRDLEEQLRVHGKSIFALETRRRLADFDMIGITLPYELCYTNILTILALGKVPFESSERTESHPFVIGGGSGSCNPEPVADFFDAVLLGDGEEAILEIAGILKNAKRSRCSRRTTLAQLAAVPGVYVPSFFQPIYSSQGDLLAVKPLKKDYGTVRRRILPDLQTSHTPEKPLVPLVRIIHDRLGIEVARGCTRGCRFCQAGIIYRPVRERTADKVVALAEKGMAAGGFEELALLSLSTGDYSCLSPALGRLMDRFAKDFVSVSMPSMRVGTLTPEIMQQIKRVRKTGFTLAPEAGTDRLRNVINKGISEEDLIATCKDAKRLGWKLLKFYFMLGLPTETLDDVKAIGDLVSRAVQASGDRNLRINIGIATFVPKPHTPFQWEPQISIAEAFARIDLVKKTLPRGNYKMKWHDPRQSFLEGVMSRGDRPLARLIEAAWQQGARLDAWTEQFDLRRWQDAAAEVNIDLDRYLRRRDFSEVLPWHHLDTGVDEEFLRAELAKAWQGDYTRDCRVHGCQNCGVCDFKEIRPVVQCHKRESKESLESKITAVQEDPGLPGIAQLRNGTGLHETEDTASHNWYRLYYAKQGDVRFLSHLEVIQLFFQAFRRAEISLHFSQGFNPVPKASFSPALPVGTASLAEHLDVDLKEMVADEKLFLQRLNRQMPAGITIQAIAAMPDKTTTGTPGKHLTCYEITIGRDLSEIERDKLEKFMAGENFVVTKERKGKVRTVDIRQQVHHLDVLGNKSFTMMLRSEEGKATSKPLDILKAVCNLTERQVLEAEILKVWSRAVD